MKFKKNWIRMNNTEVEKNEVKSEEEEKKMNFFQKHKKGFLLGALGSLAAAGAGLLILITKKYSDNDYEEDDFDDDYEDETEETTEE